MKAWVRSVKQIHIGLLLFTISMVNIQDGLSGNIERLMKVADDEV